jgi:hypothetical protein
MRQLITGLWRDESGFIVSAELVLVATITVVGLVTGLVCVRDAILGEMNDLSGAFRALDQSYSFSGMRGCRTRCGLASWSAGSAFGSAPVLEPDFICGPAPARHVPPAPQVIAPEVPLCPPLEPGPIDCPEMLCPDAPCLESPCPHEICPPEADEHRQSLILPPYESEFPSPVGVERPDIPPLPRGTSVPFVW